MRMLAVLSLVAALLMVSAGTVDARSGCSCAMRTPQQHVNDATAAFSATVTNVQVNEPMLNGGSVTATLRTDHVYKGELGAEVEVFTKAQGPACGYEFVKGARHLVFAKARGSGLATTSCSGNRLLPPGDQPLRPSDQTQGMEPLTPELIKALGTPTRVSSEHAPAFDWTGPMAIALLIGAVALAAIVWTRRRARSR
ncbi:hypothetical protein [Nonomuraea sp. NPDC005650]|uniref:hypothetical protein n=1 Tax=Nonomuraea sp. NPDC005650 TaxID=3157045 RepID=UPI0033BDB763